MCVIYSSSLLRDPDATNALAADDNLNANVQWGEDEMQAFGRVHEMLRRVAAPSQDTAPPTVDSLISSLQVSGQGTFNSQQWEQLIALRKCLPPNHAEIFKMCQFSLCAGRVRVKASDFGLAAKLDPRGAF